MSDQTMIEDILSFDKMKIDSDTSNDGSQKGELIYEKHVNTAGVILTVKLWKHVVPDLLFYELFTDKPMFSADCLHPFVKLFETEEEEIDYVSEVIVDNAFMRTLLDHICTKVTSHLIYSVICKINLR